MLSPEAQKAQDDANKASLEAFKERLSPVDGVLVDILEKGTDGMDVNALQTKFGPVIIP